MRITGTKKLWIIILALLCALTVGVAGSIFAAVSARAEQSAAEAPSVVVETEDKEEDTSSAAADSSDAFPEVEKDDKEEGDKEEDTSSAAADSSDTFPQGEGYNKEEAETEEEEEVYDEKYDEGVLRAVSELTGIEFDVISFYSHSFEISASELFEYSLENPDGLINEISEFLNLYSNGCIVNGDKSIEDEDWFLPPDGAGTYAYYGVGQNTVWTNYYATKTYTGELGLWGSPEYTIGTYAYHWGGTYNLAPGRFGRYSFVWLDPGEEYEFGVYSTCSYSNVTWGVYNANSYLSCKFWHWLV